MVYLYSCSYFPFKEVFCHSIEINKNTESEYHTGMMHVLCDQRVKVQNYVNSQAFLKQEANTIPNWAAWFI